MLVHQFKRNSFDKILVGFDQQKTDKRCCTKAINKALLLTLSWKVEDRNSNHELHEADRYFRVSQHQRLLDESMKRHLVFDLVRRYGLVVGACVLLVHIFRPWSGTSIVFNHGVPHFLHFVSIRGWPTGFCGSRMFQLTSEVHDIFIRLKNFAFLNVLIFRDRICAVHALTSCSQRKAIFIESRLHR